MLGIIENKSFRRYRLLVRQRLGILAAFLQIIDRRDHDDRAFLIITITIGRKHDFKRLLPRHILQLNIHLPDDLRPRDDIHAAFIRKNFKHITDIRIPEVKGHITALRHIHFNNRRFYFFRRYRDRLHISRSLSPDTAHKPATQDQRHEKRTRQHLFLLF